MTYYLQMLRANGAWATIGKFSSVNEAESAKRECWISARDYFRVVTDEKSLVE